MCKKCVRVCTCVVPSQEPQAAVVARARGARAGARLCTHVLGRSPIHRCVHRGNWR